MVLAPAVESIHPYPESCHPTSQGWVTFDCTMRTDIFPTVTITGQAQLTPGSVSWLDNNHLNFGIRNIVENGTYHISGTTGNLKSANNSVKVDANGVAPNTESEIAWDVTAY